MMYLFRFNERKQNNMGKFQNIIQQSLDDENANNYLANGIYRLAAD